MNELPNLPLADGGSTQRVFTQAHPDGDSGRPQRLADDPQARRPTRRTALVDDARVRRVLDGVTLVLAFYLVQQMLWPAPVGVLVQGMVVGGLTALIAFGIALVYRANRIINFAQGDLGGAPAALAVLLIVGPRWNYFLAMLTGLAAAVALGALVEFAVVRRFFRAPRLILTVATIGLAQVLAGMEVGLPRLFKLTVPPQSFPSPFDFSFTIQPIVFRGNDVVAMVAVPVAIVGLLAFLRFTSIGIAVRASAENTDRAALLGVNVKRIHTVVWIVATVLATTAMLLRAGVLGLPIGSVLGPGMVLRALAAAVLGRMERLSVILAASVGLGVIEQAVVWHTGRGPLVDPILFLVVLGSLLLQRRNNVSRADDQQTSSWQAAKEVRPIPNELKGLPEVRWALRGLAAAVGVVLLLLPPLLGESRTNLAAAVLIFGVIGVSLVVLTGWAGQVSLGQMALVGIGAAVAGAITTHLHWDLTLGVLLGGLAGAAAATVIGLPALRIRGLFLAVTTLGFALATSSYLLNPEFVRWLPTQRIPRTPLLGRITVASEARFYYLALAGLALALYTVRGLRRSRTGRVLIAMRENERALQAAGVNVTRAKLTAFAISGFLAAYAGGLFIYHQQNLVLQSFSPEASLQAFTMVVIGGLGSVPGALVGAVYVRGLAWFLPSSLRFISFLASGVGMLIVLLLVPGGLGALLYGLRDRYLRWVAARRALVVPSLVADRRGSDAAVWTTTRATQTAGDAGHSSGKEARTR